ncbi:MAG: class I SAM-dependent methyltransferase [Thermodesulfobacteriota bacterium]
MAVENYYVPVAQEFVAILKTGRIPDLGTGPGYLPIEIVKRNPHIRIHGIDLSRRLIEIDRSNDSRAGLAERLCFEVGNASRLGDKNSLQVGESIGESALACQYENGHIMLGARRSGWTGAAQGDMVRDQRKGVEA